MYFGALASSRQDEALGTVDRVLVDLNTNEVLAYVVHKTTGQAGDVVVPNSLVSEVDDDLALKISSREADDLVAYDERKGLQGKHGKVLSSIGTPAYVEISRRTRVVFSDGEAVGLQGFIIDDFTAEVTALLVHLPSRPVPATIPLAWASSLRGDQITLQCTKADV